MTAAGQRDPGVQPGRPGPDNNCAHGRPPVNAAETAGQRRPGPMPLSSGYGWPETA
jgi:hypothetical protein